LKSRSTNNRTLRSKSVDRGHSPANDAQAQIVTDLRSGAEPHASSGAVDEHSTPAIVDFDERQQKTR
jgi:hypothetical protein